MKTYPHIDGPSKAPKKPCIAFEKYDGSNLRFEWSKKRGFYKFGTKNRLFDESDPDYGTAIQLFNDTLADFVVDIVTANFKGIQKFIAYAEFLGERSFAGQHHPDDLKFLKLFDVNIHQKGFIPPNKFVKFCCNKGNDHVARVIYEGNLNHDFINKVRDGEFDVFEGVVCKGMTGKSIHTLWMTKIKTNAYRKKLEEVYQGNWENFWE